MCKHPVSQHIPGLYIPVLEIFLSLISQTPTPLSASFFSLWMCVCVCLLLSVIAECEMTRGTRQSAEHTRLSGNEKWCWCQRWNRPNHPWAELHNSNIFFSFFFFYSPSSFIRYRCLVLWHALPRSLSVQTDLISTPLCSSDIAAPQRAVCWDWNEDQVTRHGKACWERPAGRETKAHVFGVCVPVKGGSVRRRGRCLFCVFIELPLYFPLVCSVFVSISRPSRRSKPQEQHSLHRVLVLSHGFSDQSEREIGSGVVVVSFLFML